MSNVRQLTVGTVSYAVDHDQNVMPGWAGLHPSQVRFLMFGTSDSINFGPLVSFDYMGDASVLFCPGQMRAGGVIQRDYGGDVSRTVDHSAKKTLGFVTGTTGYAYFGRPLGVTMGSDGRPDSGEDAWNGVHALYPQGRAVFSLDSYWTRVGDSGPGFYSDPTKTVLACDMMYDSASEEDLLRRLQTARNEVDARVDYDYVVVNDAVDECVDRLRSIVLAQRSRRDAMRETADRIADSFGREGVESKESAHKTH